MARSLGEAHGWRKRHTSFDLWHLAAAWTLGAGAFLTFDERQKEIGRTLSFRTS
jgi:aryl carrier-like protein